MEEFEEIIEIEFDDEEFEGEDDIRLTEIYKLAVKLLEHLDRLKSQELKEATSLMIIRELLSDDRVLIGLASKMIQDLSLGYEDDPTYSS
ncbi:hypothetical protein GAH_01554 [Geoglobus ahangari]|uniref:Uncharacterized protein n=1 Tax=Geoglobus ahangari TaxID=113653 RepID=A0A0F7ID01_9EURY|nr:hypothetical protein [Geoglobus ahangari]AKG91158.1 hypothetical protein GAH_01554 [Geoglobus ahangari]NOY12038.1 hypothetical protein [Archaeoglobi archaeon]